MEKPIEKKRFETMVRVHPDGSMEKAIFIAGERLDYSIDISSYLEACKMGLQFKLAVQHDIVDHFTKCVSEVVGRRITREDLVQAIKTGWI